VDPQVIVVKLKAGEDSVPSSENSPCTSGDAGLHVQHLSCLGGLIPRSIASSLGMADLVALNGLVSAFGGRGFARVADSMDVALLDAMARD